ncbi:MAG: TAT-variant-translocated molybdopterin oxidoreductase, partial [Rhodanobacteraceae bacterium]
MSPIAKPSIARPTSAGDAPRFDANAVRNRLASARGPVYWRSLEELAGTEEFRCWLREQHPQLAETLMLDRRGFLKFLGASLALAGLAACSHPPQHELVPYINAPDGQVEGLPRFFATALTRQGFARGVLVESNEGRPTKVEGNPQHPASLGATDIFAQASVLQLWDPDRSQSVMHAGVDATWDDFEAAQLAMSNRLQSDGGAGLHILTGAITSPTLSAQLDALLAKYPRARWHVHEPAGDGNAIGGAEQAFGRPLATRYRFDRAKTILALDADFLSDPRAGVRYARDFAATRLPDAGAMSRLYVVEPTPSLTGAMADHRLPVESRRVAAFARELAHRLGVAGNLQGTVATWSAPHAQWLDALVADLRANRDASLILVGATQPAEVHALGHAMNFALGSVAKTIDYSEPVQKLPAEGGTLDELVTAMRAGTVETLLVLDTNPAYDAPIDLGFVEALKRVKHVVHLGLYRDETGMLAEWHLPRTHELEAWSDARAFDGTASIMQPLIAPLYGGRSPHEVLALLLGDEVRDGRDLVRRQWQKELRDELSWEAALQAGSIANTALPTIPPNLQRDFSVQKRLAGIAGSPPVVDRNVEGNTDSGRLELLFRADPTVGDGTWANNGWLQELPKPMTQLTWDNAALISPAIAALRGLTNGDLVELRSHDRALKAAVWIMPGQAERSVTLHLGYGRRQAGRAGTGQGFDAYALRTSAEPWAADDLQIVRTDERYELAGTQHHFHMEGRDLLRVGTLADYLS